MSEQAAENNRIKHLVQHIERDKEKFISDIHSAIQNHVSSKRVDDCLKLVTRRNGNVVTWSIYDNVPYILRLIAYLRKASYTQDGRVYEVDSVLTNEILDMVLESLSKVILNHQDIISDIALTEILLQDSTRDQFLNVFLQGKAAHVLSAKGKSMIAAALLHGMQEKLQHFSASVAANLGEKVSQLLAAASKTAIVTSTAGAATKFMATASGKIILSKLSLIIAKSLAPLVAKLLAMPIIQASLKKIVIAAVIATIAKLIVAKIGVGLGAAVWLVLVPLLLAFMVKDIVDFPKKLGSALSDAVCADLSENYTRSVTDIVTELIANFTSHQVINELARNLGDDPEVAAQLGELIAAVAA